MKACFELPSSVISEIASKLASVRIFRLEASHSLKILLLLHMFIFDTMVWKQSYSKQEFSR